MAEKELLTAAKIAAKLGVTPARVTKAIKEKGIEPDNVRCGCKYFGPKAVKDIEKVLKK